MSGIVELLPTLRLSPLPEDPAGDLAERFAAVAATAVHPLEIAAAIEAEGITDRQIQRRYGRRDVFELAEELFAGIDRSFADPTPVPSAWRVSLASCLLRGVLYTLPVLGYVLGSHLLDGAPDRWHLPHGTIGLACSVLASWGWNQGLSHRVHLWLGLGDRRGAALALLRGAPAGVLLAFTVTLIATLGAAPHGTPAGELAGRFTPVWFGLGQSLYFAASTVLLLLGLDRLLLLSLLPTVGGALWLLAAGSGPAGPGGTVRLALLLASLLASVLLAGGSLGRILLRHRAAAGRPPAEPLDAVLPYGLFGLAIGTLTLAAGLGDFIGRRAGHAGPAAPHTVALTFSMGVAEWLLYDYRRRIDGVLGTALSPGDFSRGSAYALIRCLGGYLALLAGLAYGVTAAWNGSASTNPVELLGLLMLGATVWTGLVLQATGFGWTAAGVCGGAALGMIALLTALYGGGPGTGPVDGGSAAEAIACGIAAAVLVALSGRLLGHVTRHR